MFSSHPNVIDVTRDRLSGQIADVPCWTCRRRRLKCDSVKPSCVKCTRAGIECLGYRPIRPFTWVGANGGRKKPLARLQRAKEATATSPTDIHQKSYRSLDEPAGDESTERDTETPSSTTDSPTSDVTDLLKPFFSTHPSFAKITSRQLIQEHSSRATEYICYYEQRCCMECSIYDMEDLNPFRRFLLMAKSSPLVYHAIVSLAAHHRARLSVSSLWPRRLSSLTEVYEIDGHDGDKISPQLLSSPHYSDALLHKKQALQHLRLALADRDYSDAVVVSALLLIWIELLESGHRSWRYHLGGLRSLLYHRARADSQASAGASILTRSPLRGFGENLQEVFLILQTFGSTLSRDKVDLSTMFDDKSLQKMFQRAERQTWTGCPAEFLRILSCFNSLAAQLDSGSAHHTQLLVKASALFTQLESFSCLDWAKAYPESQTVEQRNDLAHAYKVAITAYGRQLIRVPGRKLEDMESAVADAIACLSKIDPQDIHLKGCLWPAFVLGAEARNDVHRAAVLRILHDLYNLLHVRSIGRGILALERLWWRGSEALKETSWLEILYEEGEELLLV